MFSSVSFVNLFHEIWWFLVYSLLCTHCIVTVLKSVYYFISTKVLYFITDGKFVMMVISHAATIKYQSTTQHFDWLFWCWWTKWWTRSNSGVVSRCEKPSFKLDKLSNKVSFQNTLFQDKVNYIEIFTSTDIEMMTIIRNGVAFDLNHLNKVPELLVISFRWQLNVGDLFEILLKMQHHII